MVIVSSASLVGSFSILVTFQYFPKLRKKQIYEIINYFSLATFITSAGSMIGLPEDGSAACWAQGIITNIFTLSSIAWNLIISYTLYSILIEEPYDLDYKTHILCWGLPVIVSLLPLSNTRYGNNGGHWCFIVPSSSSTPGAALAWEWFSFYLWIWLAVAINIGLLVRIQYMTTSVSNHQNTHKSLAKIVKKLRWYPYVIILSWSVSTIVDSMIGARGDHSFIPYAVLTLSNVVPCFQGVLTTIVFWFTMSDLRRRWWAVITGEVKVNPNASSAFSSRPMSMAPNFRPEYVSPKFADTNVGGRSPTFKNGSGSLKSSSFRSAHGLVVPVTSAVSGPQGEYRPRLSKVVPIPELGSVKSNYTNMDEEAINVHPIQSARSCLQQEDELTPVSSNLASLSVRMPGRQDVELILQQIE